MAEFLVPGLVLAGVVIGALLTWLLSRGRITALVDAAVSRAEAVAQAELAQLRERVRTGEENQQKAQAAFSELKREADELQEELGKSCRTNSRVWPATSWKRNPSGSRSKTRKPSANC